MQFQWAALPTCLPRLVKWKKEITIAVENTVAGVSFQETTTFMRFSNV